MMVCLNAKKSRVVMLECSFLTCARFWPAFSTTGPRYDILRGDPCPHYGAVAELLLFDMPPLNRPRHEPCLGSPRRCPTGASNSYPRVSSVNQSCLLFSCLAAINVSKHAPLFSGCGLHAAVKCIKYIVAHMQVVLLYSFARTAICDPGTQFICFPGTSLVLYWYKSTNTDPK